MIPRVLVFDHIGIVVKDADQGCRTLMQTVGSSGVTARFDDHLLGVSVRFLRDPGGMVYELIAPLGDASPVARTLQAKSSLLNQIAYRVPSIPEAAAILRSAGNLPLGPARPAIAFGGHPVQFFWNKLGFVVELVTGPLPHDFGGTL